MKVLGFLLVVISVHCLQAVKYDGLRVKFGWSDALADVEYFFKIPRTQTEAEKDGWKRTERPKGLLPELRLYCPPGRAVCPLYDTAGFVAGLQIALPVNDFEMLVMKPESKFVKWSLPATEGEPAKEYWTSTQFFVSEESLRAGAGPQLENGETLQDGGVWVVGPDDKLNRLMRIPSTEMELNSTLYKKQNCVPNMGTHYYYNMTRNLHCEDLFPWFALTINGDLVGTGFQVVGRLTKQPYREWFEKSPSKRSVKITVPDAPDCLLDWVSTYGVVSLHIYYVDKPWEIRCGAGDSIKQPSVIDRFMLNGYKYAKIITDEFKKWFSG